MLTPNHKIAAASAAAIAAMVLAVVLAVYTGFARRVFFELFAYLNQEAPVELTVRRDPPVNSPYQRWLETARNELPVFEGLVIQDIATVALKPWPQMGDGVTGLYVHLANYQITDGRILQIPPKGESTSQRHLYEKTIYIVSGTGYTLMQQESRPLQRVNWGPGSLFTVPLNVLHQSHNSGDEPARMLMITSFPLVLNLMSNEDFIVDNPYAFTDRYDGAPDYLVRTGQIDEYESIANFVEDIRTADTRRNDFRGKGNETARWLLAGNTMLHAHISEMPPKMYKKAHRHSSDAFILFLSGEGFSVTWAEGNWNDRVRVDWTAGTLFAPPSYWYHQHLNSGSTPARYLAINVPNLVRNLGVYFKDQIEADIPEIRDEWEKAVERSSAEE